MILTQLQIDGLFRSVRNENQNLRLYTFDLQKTIALESESTLENISNHFLKNFAAVKSAAESQVVLKDSNQMIMRLYEDSAKNYDLKMLHTQRPPTLQSFKQEDRPLRMTIGVPGMLDTLHFIDDELISGPLADDFVEVAVQAAAVNFFVSVTRALEV
jgi:hypothetical protein